MEGYGNDNPGAFQSSPSVRKATGLHQVSDKVTDISIPAFREEGDRIQSCCQCPFRYFNPRLP